MPNFLTHVEQLISTIRIPRKTSIHLKKNSKVQNTTVQNTVQIGIIITFPDSERVPDPERGIKLLSSFKAQACTQENSRSFSQ